MPAPIPPVALVVEDDEHVAYLLQFMLAREGFDVHVARDGRAGKTFIEAELPPRLVLMDVMLPYHDGFELVALLRAQRDWADVPVVMLTAKTQESDIVRGLDAGASEYIVKPFQLDELLARVRRLTKAVP